MLTHTLTSVSRVEVQAGGVVEWAVMDCVSVLQPRLGLIPGAGGRD